MNHDDTLLKLEDVLRNPAASRWLRVSIQSALDRDPVDVASDARLLATLLEARADRVLSASMEAVGRSLITTTVLPPRSATKSLGVDLELPLEIEAPAADDRPVITQRVRAPFAGPLRGVA